MRGCNHCITTLFGGPIQTHLPHTKIWEVISSESCISTYLLTHFKRKKLFIPNHNKSQSFHFLLSFRFLALINDSEEAFIWFCFILHERVEGRAYSRFLSLEVDNGSMAPRLTKFISNASNLINKHRYKMPFRSLIENLVLSGPASCCKMKKDKNTKKYRTSVCMEDNEGRELQQKL